MTALKPSSAGKRERVLVAMSGGVDSSVAAALLVAEGHEVVGATMKTFCYQDAPGPSRTCCGLDGIMDARRVSDHLGIPHYVFDVEEEFARDVVDDFVSEYARGRTPNPCVRCNANTKFRDLLRRGRALGCTAIATGHYARVVREKGRPPALLRGADHEKDQAYFLWGLQPELMPLLHFPLGHLRKEAVREKARELALATAEKPESQEICFVPLGNYRDFLEKKLPNLHPALQPGPLVTTSGCVVGEHAGYAGFTVGQRKGLGGGSAEPRFVVEIRPARREVVVGSYEELFSNHMTVEGLNWIGPNIPREGDRVGVQIRHRALDVPARVTRIDAALEIEFELPQRAVTPGQSAAVFDGEQILGGGRISHAGRVVNALQ
jgi:tRNA-specific 2-thiouridylase